MKNIQSISDSYLCSNCGACSAVCPKDAIEFTWSNIGRLYAQVNDKCIDCGKCLKVCPSIDENRIHDGFADRFVGDINSVYIGRAIDDEIFKNSQSGGVATAILAYLFDKKLIDAALVCRMSFGEVPQVNPVIVSSKEQLLDTQKSCYTPVPLLTKLRDTDKFRSIAVVGIPCHIQGIESLMRESQKFDNIKYRIGLVCDRTECNGIQSVITQITGLQNTKVVWRQKYNCKSSCYDYKNAPLVVKSENGEEKVLPRYYRTGLKDMFTPPRCFVCWDKINVFADITLGDPWRLSGVNEKEGESLVVVRTDKGRELIQQMMMDSCVSLRQVSDDAPIKSQLIDARRHQVVDYSSAFSVLPLTTDSYLLHQEIQGLSANCDKAKKVLEAFATNEHKSESEIVHIAKNELVRIETDRKVRNSFSRKLLGKVKSFCARLHF